ncbi:MAG: hypothetical protein LBS01_03235 [Prevotellaceae bacterium]|nr:hypothetical protein [Prevotellaceae bacterium]
MWAYAMWAYGMWVYGMWVYAMWAYAIRPYNAQMMTNVGANGIRPYKHSP